MAKMEFSGVDDFIAQLDNLQAHTKEMCGVALYNGAAIVADAVKEAVVAMPTDNRLYVKDGMKTGPSREQKKCLIEGFGIAKMREDSGFYNVKVGFDGYNSIKTKTWPNGQPNSMIARAIESGTSFMRPNKFMSKAINRSKKSCEEAMQKSVEKYVEDLTK
jgi:HK97 gp10 family phage protein